VAAWACGGEGARRPGLEATRARGFLGSRRPGCATAWRQRRPPLPSHSRRRRPRAPPSRHGSSLPLPSVPSLSSVSVRFSRSLPLASDTASHEFLKYRSSLFFPLTFPDCRLTGYIPDLVCLLRPSFFFRLLVKPTWTSTLCVSVACDASTS